MNNKEKNMITRRIKNHLINNLIKAKNKNNLIHKINILKKISKNIIQDKKTTEVIM